MRISPLEIEQQTFNKALRGYNPVEVTTYLETLAGEFEKLIAENAELTEKVKDFSSKLQSYKEIEKTLQDTLVTSQKAVEEAKRNVQKEADLIVQQAQLEKQQILGDAQAQLAELNRKIANLQMAKERYISEFRGFLNTQWHLLETIESGVETARSSTSSVRRRARPQGEKLDKMLRDIDGADSHPETESTAQS